MTRSIQPFLTGVTLIVILGTAARLSLSQLGDVAMLAVILVPPLLVFMPWPASPCPAVSEMSRGR